MPGVDALIAAGRYLEAIRVLTAANRERRDHETERRLVRLRLEAFAELDRSGGPPSWPPAGPADDVFAARVGPPEVNRAALTADVLRSGIQRHGCVVVRGLVNPTSVAQVLEGIECAFAACDAHVGDSPWYQPFDPGSGDHLFPRGWDPLIPREWVRRADAILAVDSPPTLFDVIEALEEAGVGDLLTAYLGERPVLSAKKTALRWARSGTDADWWHQDGAFLGADIHAVNVWIALSHCGEDAPSIDFVDRRLNWIVETGAEGARYEWSVGPDALAHAKGDTPVVRPTFAPGDALLFDQFFLHRTGVSPGMTRDRFAIEAWCFGSSTFPPDQIPIVY